MVLNDGSDQSESGRHSQKEKEATKHDKVFRGGGGGGDMGKKKRKIRLDKENRLEICHDRRDRRSCKNFVSCVNFSRKQRSYLHILQVYTHLNVNFLHNS